MKLLIGALITTLVLMTLPMNISAGNQDKNYEEWSNEEIRSAVYCELHTFTDASMFTPDEPVRKVWCNIQKKCWNYKDNDITEEFCK